MSLTEKKISFRKLSVNPGNRGATTAKSASYEPKVSAKQRVKEFGEETPLGCLMVSFAKLVRK